VLGPHDMTDLDTRGTSSNWNAATEMVLWRCTQDLNELTPVGCTDFGVGSAVNEIAGILLPPALLNRHFRDDWLLAFANAVVNSWATSRRVSRYLRAPCLTLPEIRMA
jgi:hypothetical protein